MNTPAGVPGHTREPGFQKTRSTGISERGQVGVRYPGAARRASRAIVPFVGPTGQRPPWTGIVGRAAPGPRTWLAGPSGSDGQDNTWGEPGSPRARLFAEQGRPLNVAHSHSDQSCVPGGPGSRRVPPWCTGARRAPRATETWGRGVPPPLFHCFSPGKNWGTGTALVRPSLGG